MYNVSEDERVYFMDFYGKFKFISCQMKSFMSIFINLLMD